MRGSHLRSIAVAAALSASLGTLGVAGCQSYEMDPVEPKAVAAVDKPVQIMGTQLPPNVMLVVDKSGSMLDGADGTDSACMGTNGKLDRSKSCKWNDLLKVFAGASGFLSGNAQAASAWGLMAYPNDYQCGVGRQLVDLQPSVDEIISELNRVEPEGGTPTAPTLLEILKNPKMTTLEANRQNVVMLLTDGLPNCNPKSVALCGKPGSCEQTFDAECLDEDPFPGSTCLDEGGLEAAVAELHAKGIQTFVIGFGKDTSSGPANRVLNKAAVAGGLARENSDVKYYQANNSADLEQALKDFIISLDKCSYSLDPVPTNAKVVQVKLEDTASKSEELLVQGTDWNFSEGGISQIDLTKTRCEMIKSADARRFNIRFSYASNL